MNSSTNHQSSAVKGGQGSIPTPANSGGSGIFGSTSVGATHGGGAKVTRSTSTDEGARRTSQDANAAGLFGNLSQLKRNSNDMNRAGRKNSMAEQLPQPGVVGQMFNKLTKGGEHK